jgi:ubiquinol-cytochrome c reductase cytochrome b subunit
LPAKISERLSFYLPRIGLCSLILCLFSGIILAFQYRPYGNVFQNIEEITTLMPYGWFFRQLHYISGQVFAVLMLIHTADHFMKRRYEKYPAGQWFLLVFSLCLCFFTLFTGFILKGDMEGIFAGRIFMNIIATVPLAGKSIAGLFIDSGERFFLLPFLHHCIFLPVLIVYLLRGHIREWLPGYKYFAVAIIGLSLYALLVDPFPDIPPDSQADLIKGPWFFLGIQSLLKIMPPLTAGILIPLLFVGAMLILPVSRGMISKYLHYILSAAFCAYVILTVRAFIWGP